jgi:hypothetical protein
MPGIQSRARFFTARQVTVIVVAACIGLVAAPVAARAAAAAFSSASASTPAVAAKDSSSVSGAKGVYGYASGSSGTTYGVYGRAASPQGYGVYSAGRLGTSGSLVCSHCVTGGDLDVTSLPTVPDASKLGGHEPSYYARIVPLSWRGTTLGDTLVVDVDGLDVHADCEMPSLHVVSEALSVAANSSAQNGTLSWFSVASATASSSSAALSTTEQTVAVSNSGSVTEGTAIYHNTATGQIIDISFHLSASNCELFGEVTTGGS